MDRFDKIWLTAIGGGIWITAYAVMLTGCTTDQKIPDHKVAAQPERNHTATPKKEKTYGDGEYIVTEDIPYGTYVSSGAKTGAFSLCTVTSEPWRGSAHMPILKVADEDERIILILGKYNEGDVLSIDGCEPFVKRG